MTEIEQIFISYKSEYRDLAINVRDQLQAWGYHTWLDIDQIKPDGKTYWVDAIDRGLETSDVILGILTPEALESRPVRNEWDWAIEYEKPLILLEFVECKLISHHYNTLQRIRDFIDNHKSGFEKLHKVLSDGIAPIAPPPLKPMPKFNTDRETMLNLVQSTWVEGVLHATLRENEAFNIPRSLAPDSVLQHVEFGEYILPPDADILQIFEDMHRQLLILGAPGGGKTILMLQLAEKLISAARIDPQQPIPVVFNLASWAAKPDQSLDAWLIDSLKSYYGVSQKLGQTWLEGEKLLLLLDGLDEVALEHRDACVEAINSFRRKHQLTDIVVCSRIKDYEALTSRLDLRSGIMLQGLKQAQIDAYLASDAYMGLREVLRTDIGFQEIARTPFLLNTMALVYKNVPAVQMALAKSINSETARRKDLMMRYVNLRLSNVSDEIYPSVKVNHYLIWLAIHMTKKRITIFRVADLDSYWLYVKQKLTLHFFQSLFKFIIPGLFVSFFLGSTIGVLLDLPKLATILSLTILIISIVAGGVRGLLYIGAGAVEILAYGTFFSVDIDTADNRINRLLLRIVLWKYNYTPLNYKKFLTYCTTKLHFLKQVGNGFVFRHRMLQDYFASQYHPDDYFE